MLVGAGDSREIKKAGDPHGNLNQGVSVVVLVCFFGEGIISLREDGRGYENPGFGCLPGMKLHFTCFSSLGPVFVDCTCTGRSGYGVVGSGDCRLKTCVVYVECLYECPSVLCCKCGVHMSAY